MLEEALVHLVPADDAPPAGKGVGRDWSGLTVLFKCVNLKCLAFGPFCTCPGFKIAGFEPEIL